MKQHITLFAMCLLFNANMQFSSHNYRQRTWNTKQEVADMQKRTAERNKRLQRSHQFHERLERSKNEAADGCLGISTFFGGVIAVNACILVCLNTFATEEALSQLFGYNTASSQQPQRSRQPKNTKME